MANHVFIATSLDGFIADAHGGIDWLTSFPAPGGEDFGYAAFMQGIDAIVMGRGTFEVVRRFEHWPYDKPVFVASSTLARLPRAHTARARLVRGSPQAIVACLTRMGLTELYIDGGRTIQRFLADDMIDTMTITRAPLLLGAGIPLFGAVDHPIRFTHRSTVVFSNGMVQSRHTRGA